MRKPADGPEVALEIIGGTPTIYRHGPGLDERLSTTTGATTRYVHYDGLGSVVALTDGTGAVNDNECRRALRQSDGRARLRTVSAMSSRNHIHRFQSKGERVYQRLRARLESRYKGRIMAIEVDSGQYVIGKDELQVALRAVKKFPGKKFSFIRIGYPAVHKLRLRVCLQVE